MKFATKAKIIEYSTLLISIETGYNTEDIRNKFNKVVEKNADNDVDIMNAKLADLGRVSVFTCFFRILFQLICDEC